MHASVMNWARLRLTAAEIQNRTILEVGSLNVNGSLREVIEPLRPLRYTGVDATPGPGVDLVWDATRLTERLPAGGYDVVVSTEMLEHAADWRTCVNQLKAMLRYEGLLVLTCRGPGMPYHAYPEDHWRFTVTDIARAFEDFFALACQADPGLPGVLYMGYKSAKQPVDLSRINPARAPRR